MATASFSRIISSKLVTFIIGPESKEFTVHSTAVSTLSRPLDRLLNGNMQEAVEGRVVWEDLDEETFVRFIYWAYTGGYDVPEPDILLDATHETGTLTIEATSIYGDDKVCPKCINMQSSKKNTLAKRFTSDTSIVPSGDLTSPRQNKEELEDYSQIFLAHARLYILADKYDIPKLGELAYQLLWATLKDFTLYPSRAKDVISLILYTFGAFSKSARDNKMCNMLALYAACIFEDLVKCDAFEELIDQSPIFTHQIMKMIAERLD